MDKSQKIITKRPNGTKKVVTIPLGKTKTQIQFQKQCNVNNIIAKYKKTGSITHIRNVQEGIYADLANVPDYQEALNTVIKANITFEAMPAQLRNRFNNSPKELIEFLSNPSNRDEASKLGLLKPEPPKNDDQTTITPPSQPQIPPQPPT